MSDEGPVEKFKNESYARRYATGIFEEVPSADNPYCFTQQRCYGYDQLELIQHLSFPQYLYLLLRGQLPEADEAGLLQKALIAFSSPGVRHPATRAAVSAGVGRTVPTSVLPAALMVMAGEEEGAGSIESAMRFLRKVCKKDVDNVLSQNEYSHVFGLIQGSENIYLDGLCQAFLEEKQWPCLAWGQSLILRAREQGQQLGWLLTGLVAAVLCDLTIQPRYAPALLQFFVSPGLLVQGLENAHRAPTIMPFVNDDDYVMEDEVSVNE